jgi:hypothetical protein
MNTQPRDSDAASKPSNATDTTPNADMQPEDAGTADSGADGETRQSGEGDRARTAMKQTSKTGAETGGKR